jgi:hypothetical protein
MIRPGYVAKMVMYSYINAHHVNVHVASVPTPQVTCQQRKPSKVEQAVSTQSFAPPDSFYAVQASTTLGGLTLTPNVTGSVSASVQAYARVTSFQLHNSMAIVTCLGNLSYVLHAQGLESTEGLFCSMSVFRCQL